MDNIPTSDEIKHFGAAMASYGSTPLFHLVGITPEAQNLADCGGDKCHPETITADDIEQLGAADLVVAAIRLMWLYLPPLNYLSSRCNNLPVCAAVQHLKYQ